MVANPKYELLYHPGIPGRGEFIRLAFEAAGEAYTDVANDEHRGASEVYASAYTDSQTNTPGPPSFCPPALRIVGGSSDGRDILLNQTANVLLYLGKRIGMAPADDIAQLYVNQLTLTALDVNSEVHDTHHPVSVSEYYEAQKEEALRRATDFRVNRLPKFFKYFTVTLARNAVGQGKYLVGDTLTYADTTLWQVLDGLYFAFPNEMAARKEEFPELLGAFYNSVKEQSRLKAYLASKRRLPYGSGIYRHYPELDR